MEVPVCKLEEIPEMGARRLDFFGREILFFKAGGEPKVCILKRPSPLLGA